MGLVSFQWQCKYETYSCWLYGYGAFMFALTVGAGLLPSREMRYDYQPHSFTLIILNMLRKHSALMTCGMLLCKWTKLIWCHLLVYERQLLSHFSKLTEALLTAQHHRCVCVCFQSRWNNSIHTATSQSKFGMGNKPRKALEDTGYGSGLQVGRTFDTWGSRTEKSSHCRPTCWLSLAHPKHWRGVKKLAEGCRKAQRSCGVANVCLCYIKY